MNRITFVHNNAYVLPGVGRTNQTIPLIENNDILRVLIPCYGEEVAPLFESASRFRYWKFESGEIVRYNEITVEGADGLAKMKLIRTHQIDVLLCNGIQDNLRLILEVDGCSVVNNVAGPAADALFGYLAGLLEQNNAETFLRIADLEEWTKQLFIITGWTVKTAEKPLNSLVGITARRICPVCKKEINVAVCCGSHAIRVESEITDFAAETSQGYSARVFVHQKSNRISPLCRNLGVELLDPGRFHRSLAGSLPKDLIPPVRGPFKDHDQLI